MKTFLYEGQIYIRCVPGKNLFRSTMVHEVVNRGDIFALRVSDQILTIIPGTAKVTHYEHDLSATKQTSTARRNSARRTRISKESGQGELPFSGNL